MSAALLHLHELDSVPYPVVPASVKSLWMRRMATDAQGALEPFIGVLPNPANDRVAFTYPQGTENGTLEIHDGQGRLVRSIALNGRKGMVEGTVQGLPARIYSVRLLLDGFNLGSSKFTVMR